MSELIDRNALIDALMTYTWRDEDEHLIDDWDDKRRFIEDWLPSLPTIEAEPVRHGHWEFIGGYGYQYRCSRCVNCVERKTKYCPNCGARMDEVSE